MITGRIGIKTKSEPNLSELLFRLRVLNLPPRRVSLTVNDDKLFVIGIPDKHGIGFIHYTFDHLDLLKTTNQLYKEITKDYESRTAQN